jgi:hypothetical protein
MKQVTRDFFKTTNTYYDELIKYQCVEILKTEVTSKTCSIYQA